MHTNDLFPPTALEKCGLYYSVGADRCCRSTFSFKWKYFIFKIYICLIKIIYNLWKQGTLVSRCIWRVPTCTTKITTVLLVVATPHDETFFRQYFKAFLPRFEIGKNIGTHIFLNHTEVTIIETVSPSEVFCWEIYFRYMWKDNVVSSSNPSQYREVPFHFSVRI